MNDERLGNLRRRELLILGSASMAGWALAAPSAAAAVGVWRAAGEELRVGWAPRDTEIEALASRWSPRLVDARSLALGDAQLGRSDAQLEIHGLLPAAASPGRDLQSLSVGIDYHPHHDGFHHAWCFENGPVPNLSPPVRLRVPIDPAFGLNLIVELRDRSGTRELPLRLSVGGEAGTPKLRPGRYVIAAGDSRLPELARLLLSVEPA
jgi:hypothetical protein